MTRYILLLLIFFTTSYCKVISSKDYKEKNDGVYTDIIMFKDGDFSKCQIIDTAGPSVYMERKGTKGKIDKSIIDYIVLKSDTIIIKLVNKTSPLQNKTIIKDTSSVVEYSRTVNINGTGNSEYHEKILFFKDKYKFKIKYENLEVNTKLRKDSVQIKNYSEKLKDYVLDNSDIIKSNYVSAYSQNPNVVKEIYGTFVFNNSGGVDCVPVKGLKKESAIRSNLIEICNEFIEKNGSIHDSKVSFKIRFKRITNIKDHYFQNDFHNSQTNHPPFPKFK